MLTKAQRSAHGLWIGGGLASGWCQVMRRKGRFERRAGDGNLFSFPTVGPGAETGVASNCELHSGGAQQAV